MYEWEVLRERAATSFGSLEDSLVVGKVVLWVGDFILFFCEE